MLNDEQFEWSDYLLFVAIAASFVSVIFHFARRQPPNLHSGSADSLGLTPISLSLVASNISCITFGLSNEVYQYGITIMFEIMSILPIIALTHLQMPVLYKLKLSTLNEYLAMRFDSKIKCCGAICILISMVSISTIITYVLALFISYLSGLSMFSCFAAVIFPCYIMTALGGFRGVVWTDALQAFVMFVSVLVLLGAGLYETGGISSVLASAREGGRLDLEWSMDPTQRLNVMSAVFGLIPSATISYGLTIPANYQRYVALSSERLAVRSVALQLAGMVFIKVIVFALGLTMYAINQACDPVKSGQVMKYDQMLAFYVNDVGSRRMKFARSIYVVGFISAGVSSLTTLINTFSVILYKDFLQTTFNRKQNRALENWLTHFSGFLLAIFISALIIPLSNSGTVTEMSSLMTTPLALYFSLFFIGLFLPWVGSKNTFWAYTVGIITAFYLTIGSRIAYSRNFIVYPTKKMRIDQCRFNVSHASGIELTSSFIDDTSHYPFRITPFYHCTIICTVVIVIAIILSLGTKDDNIRKVDENLILPSLHCFLREDKTTIPLRSLK